MGLFSSLDGSGRGKSRAKSSVAGEDVSTLSPSTRERKHRRHRHRQRNNDSNNSVAEQELSASKDEPDSDELRRLRTEYFGKTPSQRRRQSGASSGAGRDSASAARSSPGTKVEDSGSKRHQDTSRVRRKSSGRDKERRRSTRSGGSETSRLDREDAGYVYSTSYNTVNERGDTQQATRNGKGKGKERERNVGQPSTSRRYLDAIPEAHLTAAQEDPPRGGPQPFTGWASVGREQESSFADGPFPSYEPPEMQPTPSVSVRHSSTSAGGQQNCFVRPLTKRSSNKRAADDARSVAASTIRSSRRPSSRLENRFSRQHSARPTASKRTSQAAKPVENVECLTCASTIPSTGAFTIPTCGHTWCHDCLRMLFDKSTTDASLMPPKCCDLTPTIPVKPINAVFDPQFLRHWNRKRFEAATKNRLYCPKKGCGTWITPRHITTITPSTRGARARKRGVCKTCGTRVCATCNTRWHNAPKCPDKDGEKFAAMAKAQGWRPCYACGAVVERTEGCNHMSCRCKAEWCMLCGAQWKTCDCDMFSEEQLLQPNNHARLRPGDALPDLARGAQLLQRHLRNAAAGAGAQGELQDVFRHLVGFFDPPAQAGPRARGYAAQRAAQAQQEREDEALARRLQAAFDLDDGDVDEVVRHFDAAQRQHEQQEQQRPRVFGTRVYDPLARAWVRQRPASRGRETVSGEADAGEEHASPDPEAQDGGEADGSASASTMAGLNAGTRGNTRAGRVGGWLDHVVVVEEEWE